MGRVVTFAELAGGGGVVAAPITQGDTARIGAEFLKLPAGGRLPGKVPAGSDAYIFVLSGTATLAAGGAPQTVKPQAFATMAEGTSYELAAGAEEVTAVRVTAPPPGAPGPKLPGYTGGVMVTDRASVQPVLIPDQKKTRIYFVAHQAAAHSDRAHAMIVVYEKETVTDLHHHPDAESMFVLLEGRIEFVVNGGTVEVGPGQAAYFTMNDKHSLKVAEGHTGAAFLEFHLPAAFSTVKEKKAA